MKLILAKSKKKKVHQVGGLEEQPQYKKHVVSDKEGMVIGVLTTTASVNEISNLEEVLDAADLRRA